jgi:hypothetical protein
MDQSRYFVLNSLEDFRTPQRHKCVWNSRDQLFHLAINHQPRLPSQGQQQGDGWPALAAARTALPLAMDELQQLGFLSPERDKLFYARSWQQKAEFDRRATLTAEEQATLPKLDGLGPVLVTSQQAQADSLGELLLEPVTATAGSKFIDLHLGGDGRVALIESDGTSVGLRVVHLAKRWQLGLHWPLADWGAPKRVWVDQHNRIWVASDTHLLLFEGEPLPQNYRRWADRFEPDVVNPHPLRPVDQLPLPPGHELISLCANAQQLHLLLLHSAAHTQELFSIDLADYRAQPRRRPLPQLPLVTDIASVEHNRVFAQFFTLPDEVKRTDFVCLLIEDEEPEGEQLRIEARAYPLDSQLSVRFVQGDTRTLRYLTRNGPTQVLPLPQTRYRSSGSARLSRVLDSGTPDTWWDRIYLDASIPSGCCLRIRVNAYEDFANPPNDWQKQPVPLKLPIASELPFYQSRFDGQLSHQGLFEILLQRETGAVRDIRGRYLQLDIELHGDGRHTPVIECLRVSYPRQSWQEQFLPPLFRQQESVDTSVSLQGEPGVDVPANGADFRERLLSSLDGLFSPLERRIISAESWLLPQGAPVKQLPVLAALLGERLPAQWPERRQRIWLSCLSELQRWKGTLRALCLALDIATDGAVARGQVIPLENYFMRRTLATILGIDMDDAAHPLTLGTRQSGNSRVGETLILSDDHSRDFVALLAPELLNQSDKETARRFIDAYSQRLSVLVHRDAFAHLDNIRRVLADFVPAAVKFTLIQTDKPFVLGLSPLLGIDTYLEPAREARRVVLDDTWLGREGLVRNNASFSPRDQLVAAPASTGGTA